MPSSFLAVDTNFPELSGNTPQDMKKILNYLFMLTEQLRYTLYNLSPDNFNGNELEGFVDEIRAGIVITETMISNTVITESLYSHYGTIAELTVDSLRSADKIQKYLMSDTGDVNYIDIHDQTISFITGETDGSTEQLTDNDGNLLYWKGAVTIDTYKTIGMSTTVTAFPVIVYDYDETIKQSISFVLDTGTYMPKIILGAGDGVTDNSAKAVIFKGQTGLEINYYKSSTGELRQIKLSDDGITITPVDVTMDNLIIGDSLTLGERGTGDIGTYSVSFGYGNVASKYASFASGENNTASGFESHAEGSANTASGFAAHAEGGETEASGNQSHTEGNATIASAFASHAEGDGTTASNNGAHAEGCITEASGYASHAEGQTTTASAICAHAEGQDTIASGAFSHAEGYEAEASGTYSHAEGYQTEASGDNSHASNENTIAQGMSQTVIGRYNIPQGSPYSYADTDHAFIVGNGADAENQSNALSVAWNGDTEIAGNINIPTGKTLKINDVDIIGDLSTLLTTNKTSLVAALNELFGMI